MGYFRIKKVVAPWQHTNQLIIQLCILIAIICSLTIHPAHAATSSQHQSVSTKKITHKTTSRKSTHHRTKKHARTKTSTRLAQQKTKKLKTRSKLSSKVSHKKIKTPINRDNLHTSKLPQYLLSADEKRLVDYIRHSISSVNYSSYKMGANRIDKTQGIYIVDCSAFIDDILKTVYPHAFNSLSHWSGTERPTTDHFYQYFSNLEQDSNRWESLKDIAHLRPGDIIVFRYKGTRNGGHVMIVMDTPKRIGNKYSIRIADSAPSGHSKDTRLHSVSGIGIGTILLEANPHTQEPRAYAWTVGATLKKNINIAMARPIAVN